MTDTTNITITGAAAEIQRLTAQRDALAARLAEIERSEPVAWMHADRRMSDGWSPRSARAENFVGWSPLIYIPGVAQQPPAAEPARPCRTCGPDGCPDSTSCPRDSYVAMARLSPEFTARLESEAQIVDGKLVIALRIGTLAHAARHSDYFDRLAEQGTKLKITDEAVFAQSVANALNAEEEDGSTPITRMLDKAFEHVSEWGEDGIEEA